MPSRKWVVVGNFFTHFMRCGGTTYLTSLAYTGGANEVLHFILPLSGQGERRNLHPHNLRSQRSALVYLCYAHSSRKRICTFN
jgi:hypothetical protein